MLKTESFRPPFKSKGGFPPGRKSLGGTPAGDTELLVERLSYADLPRPFKNPHGFVSKLPYRTASTTTTSVKKSTKQILVLERERIGGGDGFLPANLTRARARGEIIEPGGKKKKPIGAIPGQNRRGHNLKGRKGNGAGGGLSGVSTPNTGLGSERTTPGEEDDEDEREEGGEEEEVVLPLGKEVFTYHTPTAPPSLLPTKKYCDITGLHASYTDPRTKLRYKGLDVWHVVRGLGPGSDQAYLALRGAQTHLK